MLPVPATTATSRRGQRGDRSRGREGEKEGGEGMPHLFLEVDHSAVHKPVALVLHGRGQRGDLLGHLPHDQLPPHDGEATQEDFSVRRRKGKREGKREGRRKGL